MGHRSKHRRANWSEARVANALLHRASQCPPSTGLARLRKHLARRSTHVEFPVTAFLAQPDAAARDRQQAMFRRKLRAA